MSDPPSIHAFHARSIKFKSFYDFGAEYLRFVHFNRKRRNNWKMEMKLNAEVSVKYK